MGLKPAMIVMEIGYDDDVDDALRGLIEDCTGEELVTEETSRLGESLYFVQEILLLLEDARFRDIALGGGQGGYAGEPVTPDDPVVMFVAHRPS